MSAPGDGAAPCESLPVSLETTVTELRRRAANARCSLGSVSLGDPNDGALLNPEQLTDGDHWRVAYPQNAWATSETVRFVRLALSTATQNAPTNAPKLIIGDLSTPWGGPLPPHRSHQSGRDVDVGYFRLDPADRWWTDASPRTLDVTRTWALVRAFVTLTDVEAIFIDRSLQLPLKKHALRIGEDERWVGRFFDVDGAGGSALVRHVPEHVNHMHVRFRNPVAQRVGRVLRDLAISDDAPRSAQFR